MTPRSSMIAAVFAVLVAVMGLPIHAAATPPQTHAAQASVQAAHVEVQLVIPRAELSPGTGNDVGLYFKLEPGWHVYWKNAGDSGEPPHIHWTLPDGMAAEPMRFPAPKRLPLGPLMDYGYEDEVLFPLTLDVAKNTPHRLAHLRAKVDWLVCREVCLPGKAELEIDRQVRSELMKPTSPKPNAQDPSSAAHDKFAGPAGQPTARASQSVTRAGAQDGTQSPELIQPDAAIWQRLAARIPAPSPASFKATFATIQSGFRMVVETGQRETAAVFFPSDSDVINNPAAQKLTPTATGCVLELKKDANLSAQPAQLKGILELSGGRAFEIAAVPGAVPAEARGGTDWAELVRIVGLAFVGGLLLNLMPCVFPVLFLKGLALVNSGSEERGRRRAHGFVYALGIVASFWLLVAVLVGLRAAGATLGWGFQFQSPLFLELMAGLLFFLGLSLAGQFEIGLTVMSTGGGLAAKQGYAGSFFTGVLAVVVATPCTAPLMGAAVGYALSQSLAITLVVFTALALGLAAPYVLLTLRPEWTRLLPAPGAWMDVLKQATAVPIFATVIWLAWVLAGAYGTGVLVALLGSFLLLAIAGWFLGRWPAKRWAAVVAGLILLGVVAASVFAPSKLAVTKGTSSALSPETNRGGDGVWQPWSAEAVAKYQAQGRPVFVDFTASWCLSCQVNERVALDQPQVQQAFKQANVALLKADWTQHDDAITNALTALGRNGVPAYALYKPGASAAELLPEVLTPGIVIDHLRWGQLPLAR